MLNYIFFKTNFCLTICFLFAGHLAISQTPAYWGGGSGDWDDPSHWFKEAELENNIGGIPNASFVVRFVDNSFSVNDDILTIPPGNYDVHSIEVNTNEDFLIKFDGADNNPVTMNVHGSLTLKASHRLEYGSTASPQITSNKWVFKGTTIQDITTGNHDLLRIDFLTAGTTYNQLSNLEVSQQIRLYGGHWKSNGFDVNAGKILINDGIPSNGTQLVKTLSTGTSKIFCDVWDSRLTYGSFTMNGEHIIYADNFEGSPTQNGNQMSVHSLHLLEYHDDPMNGESSVVDHNNFECTGCKIDTMIIEDTGRVKLAGTFTVEKKLEVVHHETTVEFNDGNLRSDEVFINGVVVTPEISGCLRRTIFKNSYDDIAKFIRTTGTLTIDDAILIGIQASGGADFDVSNGVLQGSSSGWNIINPPNPTNYEWIGGVSMEDWDDPTKWTVLGEESNGCIPSIVDNVYITNLSLGDIRIPANFTAQCNDVIWDNEKDLTLVLDGTTTLKSTLEVAGDFILDQTAAISPAGRHEIIFSSVDDNTISTGPVILPDIRFIGDEAEWSLQENLTCDKIVFESGTFNTQNHGVLTDEWLSITQNPKHYALANSHIIVNGEFSLSANTSSGVTVDPGTSLIECEKLTSSIVVLHDVQFNNTSNELLQDYPYTFHDLILNGTGEISTQNDLTLSNLVFSIEGSAIAIDTDYQLIIQEGISSDASLGNPGVLKSRTPGTRAEIDKISGNLCVVGPVALIDLEAVLTGVFHAPQGIDGGNNSPNINFESNASSTTLYWVGSDDNRWHIKKNWSQTDGGCPTTKNPDDATDLIFNGNSFSTSPVSVSISLGIDANDVYFFNTENLTINVGANSTMGTLNPGGYVNFTGNKILQIDTTTLLSGALMTTNMQNFRTQQLNGNDGILIVKSGSTMKINGL